MMMNAKHTPGPWHVEHEDGLPLVVDDSREMQVIYIDQEGDNREANARLIAAAPELLDALTEMVDRFDGLRESLGHGQSDLSVKARAAIAKAKGA